MKATPPSVERLPFHADNHLATHTAASRTILTASVCPLAKAKRKDYARSFVGQTVDVVIEGHDKAVGWTGEYLRCEADAAVPCKSRVRIRVTHADGERLRGNVSSNQTP